MIVEWVHDSWMSSWTVMWSSSWKPSRINKVLEALHCLECALNPHNNFFSLQYFSVNKTFVLNFISCVTILIWVVYKDVLWCSSFNFLQIQKWHHETDFNCYKITTHHHQLQALEDQDHYQIKILNTLLPLQQAHCIQVLRHLHNYQTGQIRLSLWIGKQIWDGHMWATLLSFFE